MVQQIGLLTVARGTTKCVIIHRTLNQSTRALKTTPLCKHACLRQSRSFIGTKPPNRTNYTRVLPRSRTMSTLGMGMGSNPQVTVEPGGHLMMDEELTIRVTGLSSGQEVTIHTVIRDSGKSIDSCCHFRADKDGAVDLYRHPSLGGSYTGVSAMGIFWSLEPTPDMPKGLRLIVKDLDKPKTAELAVYVGHLTANHIRSNHPTPIAKHMVDRWYKGQGVTRTEVTDGRIRGALYSPPGPGPFPGVIDLFGTVGGIVEFRSALLASRGFASLALPYFLYKDLPETLGDIDLDYFLEAAAWLRGHPKVHGAGIGVIGVSKGGDFSLIIAAHCPEVRAVVNINGCVFNSIFDLKYSKGDIPAVPADFSKMENEGDVYWMNRTMEYTEKDLTPVWRHNPHVLNIVSEDDYCAPTECAWLLKKCYPADKADRCTVLSYPNAGHLLEPPYTPCCQMSYHKAYGMYFRWGGTPKPHADAQEDAWRNILKFLHKHIPGDSVANSKL